jgi:hypothetical protein
MNLWLRMAYITIVLPKIWGKGLYYPENGKMRQNRKTHSPTGDLVNIMGLQAGTSEISELVI